VDREKMRSGQWLGSGFTFLSLLCQYEDGSGNTAEENSSISSLIPMHWLHLQKPVSATYLQRLSSRKGHRKSIGELANSK